MPFIKLFSLISLIVFTGCVSPENKSQLKQISQTFKQIDNKSNYSLESLVEAQAIVVEFYTLFKTGNLTVKSLDQLIAKFNPDNSKVVEESLGLLNQALSQDGLEDSQEIPLIDIPKDFSQPSFSKMKNKLKFLLADYEFNNEITIPNKFAFNGTSIPEIAQEWLGDPFDKKLEVPGLVHDYLYSTKSKSLNYSKKTADLAFYHLLKKNEIPESKALVMYMGVVVGGHFFYMKD